jgi:uncharacterized protein
VIAEFDFDDGSWCRAQLDTGDHACRSRSWMTSGGGVNTMSGVPTLERFTADALRSTVITFRDSLKAHAGRLNRLNVYPVPDGDTGTNMARTLDAVVAELDGAAPESEPTCQAISHGSLMGARGNSGVIMSQILRGMASTLKDASASAGATGAKVAEALRASSSAAYQAVLRPIEGTILTVVRESSEAASAEAERGGSVASVLRAARDGGRAALDRTPEMLPVLKDAGVVDAGGAGYLLLLDAALHVVDGEPLPTADPADADASPVVPTGGGLRAGATHTGDGTNVADLRYEVMYFLHLDDGKIENFKRDWGEIGDSIVVVGGDGLWNCHVHTNDIGAAIEAAIDLGGRPKQIRVTDLFEEVAERGAADHAAREASMTGAGAAVSPAELPAVATAVIAVASGPGLATLFTELGVQVVVQGGQTLNPSTAELLHAVEQCNSDSVLVLPNNKNIIPVAEQLDELSPKQVRVVPTVSMPAALAALFNYDPDGSIETNRTSMTAAAQSIATGEVTQAVRDTKSDVGEIHEGDWIGIVRGDGIVAAEADQLTLVTRLLDHLLADGGEMVTVVTGADAASATTESILEWLSTNHDGVEVEVHDGGQPLYPYLFGVE